MDFPPRLHRFIIYFQAISYCQFITLEERQNTSNMDRLFIVYHLKIIRKIECL